MTNDNLIPMNHDKDIVKTCSLGGCGSQSCEDIQFMSKYNN